MEAYKYMVSGPCKNIKPSNKSEISKKEAIVLYFVVMSLSIEALAMAGVDYVEWGLDIEEWEREDELPPPHLLADDNEKEEEEFMKRHASTRQGFSAFINNTSPPSYNLEDSERSVSELCNPGVVRYWRSKMEKIRFYFMSIAKMMPTLIKLLMISWIERRLNHKLS
ncbi:uncharacterized protein LOC128283873 [Gossypium arboreum]|uniref:Uncharacterized protein n=2 Tax=Gossypium TaxID=3633 RepID=A0ABR0N632_GOSAR|nr:uncharacterized protein LOC128283873 [Gossypium arboreum]KAK5785295.1 hypothetical protein PVK06_039864 [Gossypium arboreum]